jgi:hypothetical protein
MLALDGLKLGMTMDQVKKQLPKGAGLTTRSYWAVEDRTGVLIVGGARGANREPKPGGQKPPPLTTRKYVFWDGVLVAYLREGPPQPASEYSDWVKEVTASLGAPGTHMPPFARQKGLLFTAPRGGALSVWADAAHYGVLGAQELQDPKAVSFFLADPDHYAQVTLEAMKATEARMRAGSHGAPPPPPK